MIFVITGTQTYPFNRLLRRIDELIELGIIDEPVFAQIGCSTYMPSRYQYVRYLDTDEFHAYIDKADCILTHGGTGAIVNALKAGKKVIAVARRAEYEEHADDHQLQIVNHFKNLNFILAANDVEHLDSILLAAKSFVPRNFQSGTKTIIDIIDRFIEQTESQKAETRTNGK